MPVNKYIVITLFSLCFQLQLIAEDYGYLSVSAGDSMAIFVDTSFAGYGRIADLPLPTGEHSVHVYDPNDLSWSDRGRREEVTITAGDHIQLDFRQETSIRIFSLPYASKVYLGKDFLGQTPLVYPKENIGEKTLSIENRGFETVSLNLTDGQSVYKVTLPTSENQKQNRVERIKDNQYQIKWYREGLIVTSLVASWASFYYKREADKYYERYQRSSDSRDMISLYSKTQRYDTMAEIAIAVSATTLGTYLFLLLIN